MRSDAYVTIRFNIPPVLAHRTEHITDRILDKLDGFLTRNDIIATVEESNDSPMDLEDLLTEVE